jgi:hypothetical protein
VRFRPKSSRRIDNRTFIIGAYGATGKQAGTKCDVYIYPLERMSLAPRESIT